MKPLRESSFVKTSERWDRFVKAYSAIKRAERMEANDVYERSQEAAHYNWLDEQNEQLENEVLKLKKELYNFLRSMNKLHQDGTLEMPVYSIRRMVKLKEEIEQAEAAICK